ncbi:MAG: DUF6491 family protein [Hyphomonadaceae bacterium]
MRAMIAGAALAAAAAAAPAQAAPPSTPCFNSAQWNSWKADGAKRVYLRTSANEVFALEMKQACSQLTWPEAKLITQVRGSTQICSPMDLDLRVSLPPGSSTSCTVETIRKLTTAEAAALDKKVRP